MIDIIPAIDIINGQCARLFQGNFNLSTTYSVTPEDISKQIEHSGFTRIHVVDLDGARAKTPKNLTTLRAITRQTSLIVDFSGGIRDDEDIQNVFDSGASKVTLGTIAIEDPLKVEEWIKQYGADKIIIGVDVRTKQFGVDNLNQQNQIATHGWKHTSSLTPEDLIKHFYSLGITQYLCTDISKDGTMQGPNIPLYAQILKSFPSIYLIASGGIASLGDIKDLNNAKVPAVVLGKALYENKINLKDLWLLQNE